MDDNNADERISRVIFSYAARIGQAQDTRALLQLNADMGRDLLAPSAAASGLSIRKPASSIRQWRTAKVRFESA